MMTCKTMSVIILCVGDESVKESRKEEYHNRYVNEVRIMYMTKLLVHRMCLKQKLY